MAESEDTTQRYELLVKQLQKQLNDGNARLNTTAGERSDDIHPDITKLVTQRSKLVSELLRTSWEAIFDVSTNHALIAVGGFGRGELHPQSDIDVLILVGEQQNLDIDLNVWLGLLWDIGLTISHAVRSPRQCKASAKTDVTIATALMEARLLLGNESLFQDLLETTGVSHIWPADRFFSAKLEEQEQRHASFDDTAYRLEPNLKEGLGGLRDIQTIGWVARRYFGDANLETLVGHGFLLLTEYDELITARNFLWQVRWINHELTGRAEERLLFAQQKQLAAALGYHDQQATRAVEQFMQKYYQTLTSVQRLNERLLQQYREELLMTPENVRVIDREFQVRNAYLEVRQDDVFDCRPLAILDVFLHLQNDESIQGVRAGTIRRLRSALKAQGDCMAEDPAVLERFVDILRQQQGVYTQLARMNRYGLLARLIPGFADVTGLMQFDLFHVYTVDQHTLFVIRNLRRFAYGKYQELFGHVAEVFVRVDKPELLYLAALFHDIAKGRGGDHSQLGAKDARQFTARLSINDSESKLIAWLVNEHLLLSRTAQREDLSDPEVIHRFASKVANRERLDYLYLLTVADIAATNPDLWNSWKDMLFWDLYQKTSMALQQGLNRPLQRIEVARETRSRVFSQLLASGVDVAPLSRLWRTFPERAFQRFDDKQLLWVTQGLLGWSNKQQPLIQSRVLEDEEVTELLVAGISYDGFFATVIGQLEQMRCDVFNARIQTTNDGLAVDLFQMVDASGRPLNYSDIERLQSQLSSLLVEATVPTPVNFTIPRRLREFLSNAEVKFSHLSHSIDHEDVADAQQKEETKLTCVDVRCTDRPGLLSSIANVLLAQKVRLHDARIATFGEQVEDRFVISDYTNQPLDSAHCSVLHEALQQALDNPLVK